MNSGKRKDDYILGRTQAEYDRLRMQARAWEPVTQRVLLGAGLAAGMRCVDVGCGPGETMRLMGRLVGETGHVVGVDVDHALGEFMIAEIHREEGLHFAFETADITRKDPIPGAPFDLVFARLLLLHMTDPVGAVRNLAALVRPGGRLVLMDYDLTRMACRPEEPALTRGFEIVSESFVRSGKHADCGLRLGGYLAEAGLPPPEGNEAASFYVPIDSRGRMLRAVLTSLEATAVALGVATSDELSALQDKIAELEAEGKHFALGPLMIGVWTTVG